MRVLVINSDDSVAATVSTVLRSAGAVVYTTDLGEEGVDLAKVYEEDLILLDLDLSDMSGIDVIRKIRAAKVETPIIVLTADAQIRSKTAAFTAGADDYITLPFHNDELVLRTQAVNRRFRGFSDDRIVIENLALNLTQHFVEVGDARVHLSGKEYAVLELLMLRQGAVVTKEGVLDHLYGGLDVPEIKITDVFICNVRRKLREAGWTGKIETSWGRGYTIAKPQTIATVTPAAA